MDVKHVPQDLMTKHWNVRRDIYKTRISVLLKENENFLHRYRKSVEETIQFARMQDLEKQKLLSIIADENRKKENLEVKNNQLQACKQLSKEQTKALEESILKVRKEKAAASEENSYLLVQQKEAEKLKEKSQAEMIKTDQVYRNIIEYYKNKLGLRVQVDEDNNIVVLFKGIPASKNTVYSAKLTYSDERWKLLELTPTLSCENNLARRLEDTQDIQGFLVHLRKLFKENSTNKKKNKKTCLKSYSLACPS